MPQPSITKICLKITCLNFHLNFPGANELRPPWEVNLSERFQNVTNTNFNRMIVPCVIIMTTLSNIKVSEIISALNHKELFLVFSSNAFLIFFFIIFFSVMQMVIIRVTWDFLWDLFTWNHVIMNHYTDHIMWALKGLFALTAWWFVHKLVQVNNK